MDTGAFKRGWGGRGKPLSEIRNEPVPPYDTKGPPPDIDDFVVLHCIHISRDGLVYVCDRGNDRVQVFTKQGTFVAQFSIHPSTPARGAECNQPCVPLTIRRYARQGPKGPTNAVPSRLRRPA